MKKIKKVFYILCEVVWLLGHVGVLLLGLDRLSKMGSISNIIIFVFMFVLLFYLDSRKEESKDE